MSRLFHELCVDKEIEETAMHGEVVCGSAGSGWQYFDLVRGCPDGSSGGPASLIQATAQETAGAENFLCSSEEK